MQFQEPDFQVNLNVLNERKSIIAKNFFDEHKIKYKEINIENENISRDDLLDLAGGYTVPQIFIEEQHVGGNLELQALEHEGKLDNLLKN